MAKAENRSADVADPAQDTIVPEKTGKSESASAVDPAQKYPLSEILANSEAAFGVKAEVIAGALYGSNKDQYTHDEVKNSIEKFKKKEIK